MKINFTPTLQMEPISATAALVAAGIGALGQGANAFSQGKMNKKTRQWNEKMYGIQRRDQLSDWNMVNAYNTPQAQMERYKQAGLNPNLIYGQGTPGNAESTKQSDVKSWSPTAPDYSAIAQGATNMYMEVLKGQQQLKNMKAEERKTDAETMFITSHRGRYYDSMINVNKEREWALTNQGGLALKNLELAGQKWLFNEKYNNKLLDYMDEKTNLTKYQGYMVKDENARRENIQHLVFAANLYRALLLKEQTVTEGYKRAHIATLINKINNDATETSTKAGATFLGLDIGVYGQSKGLYYNKSTSEKVDSIMRELDSNWDKKSDKQKQEVIDLMSNPAFK